MPRGGKSGKSGKGRHGKNKPKNKSKNKNVKNKKPHKQQQSVEQNNERKDNNLDISNDNNIDNSISNDNSIINDSKENEDSPNEIKLETAVSRAPRRWKVDPNKKHPFWDNQPVPSMKSKILLNENCSIETKTLDDVKKIPYLLPSLFEWCDLDLSKNDQILELYNLLCNHYVEDDDNMFRFNYSKSFLEWALLVPNYLSQWHLGVRVVKSGSLCAAITAIPATVVIRNKIVKMVEINFLCVHKKLRSQRLAPVLIKEITRRVNCCNIWQAVYTAGVVIPKPIASNRYWHRSLNPKKLIDIGFSCMKQRMTMPRLLRLYRVNKEISIKNLREMRNDDSEQCWNLLKNYLSKFNLYVLLSLDEFKHLLLPRKDVVYSYVVENKDKDGNNIITDFISYYNLSSTVINNLKHNEMKAAYSYYNVATKHNIKDLMNDALVLAHKQGFDVFNALDVMDNSKFLKDLKFGIGDGHLQYYVYNWKCPELDPKEVGIVLL